MKIVALLLSYRMLFLMLLASNIFASCCIVKTLTTKRSDNNSCQLKEQFIEAIKGTKTITDTKTLNKLTDLRPLYDQVVKETARIHSKKAKRLKECIPQKIAIAIGVFLEIRNEKDIDFELRAAGLYNITTRTYNNIPKYRYYYGDINPAQLYHLISLPYVKHINKSQNVMGLEIN